MTICRLSPDDIRADARCQPRAQMDPELVEEYAAAMGEGASFPPLTVFHDGETSWLADGFHRLAAAKRLGLAEIDCEVKPGTLRDAMLFAVSANATHGKRRSNLDKRRAVEKLLHDEEWRRWSDSQIARQCAVSSNFVGTVRRSLSSDESDIPSERTYTDRWGNTSTMRTGNIGKPAVSTGNVLTIPAHVADAMLGDEVDEPVDEPAIEAPEAMATTSRLESEHGEVGKGKGTNITFSPPKARGTSDEGARPESYLDTFWIWNFLDLETRTFLDIVDRHNPADMARAWQWRARRDGRDEREELGAFADLTMAWSSALLTLYNALVDLARSEYREVAS